MAEEERSPTFSQLAEEISLEKMDQVSKVATSIWGGGYDPDRIIKSRDIPQRMLGDMGITRIQ